jgi:hypothetical protein
MFSQHLPIIVKISVEILKEVASDPLDEIRGHLTASNLRDWIKQNTIGIPAKKCALYYNKQQRIVSVFILAEDDSFLYSNDGKKIAAVFSAKSMDEDIRDLFGSKTTVIFSL